MFDLIFIALFQAASGSGEPAPVPATTEQTAAASGAVDPTTPATNLDGPSVPGETQGRAERANERTCREATLTGSRVSRRNVCMSETDRNNHRQAATDMINSSLPGVSH